MRITVIKGGTSAERDVSLRTGTAIEKALTELGHEVKSIDPKTDDLAKLATDRPDVVFLALHGKGGEDGSIQGFLQTLKIPYTSSGVLSSALCYDKILTKLAVQYVGVLTPEFYTLTAHVSADDFLKLHGEKISYPVIVKPSREGSTFGINVARDKSELLKHLNEAKSYCPDVLVEQFIQGTEVTVSILNGKALPVVEIAPKKGFFDYEAKYTPGQTEYFAPARISDALSERLKQITETVYCAVNCRGQARMDFMIDQNQNAYFLEVNTIPGMTETSLLPKAAKCVGIDFKTLCGEILKSASLDS